MSEEKLRHFLKRVTANLHETRQRLQEIESAAGEPVAIVAMSCRYPGGARTPESLWELLATGGDAISEFPADRGWNVAELYDPDPDHAGTSYTRSGGFVYDACDFDPAFFGISPREAMAMDPQQRLLLETSWELLERAAIDPVSLHGSQTGVFVGASSSGYGFGADAPRLPRELEGHVQTGAAASMMSGRISYLLGLEGPAVTVDTACSSALVALHLACQALRTGECTLALTGGVAVTVMPSVFIWSSRQRSLATDGRSKSFSAAADGMSMSEGVGMLLLERLSDARRNGHQVLAVIRGSAVNQDGASNGLTAPNGLSQQRVIKAALAAARLSPGDIDAVEAHGSGTRLGDPIEAQALLATYGQNRPAGQPLWLGSVKSNIGHPQQAAGAAGVIKMVLALQHGVLPRTLHADEPSPHVDWSSGAVRLLNEAVDWPAHGERLRRAGVSAFGASGTNVHVILEEPPAVAGPSASGPVVRRPVVSGMLPWILSGRSPQSMRAQAVRLHAHLAAHPGLDPADIAWSLATTRTAFEHRTVVLGAGRPELTDGLAAVIAGRPEPTVISRVATDLGRVVFVFSGHGAQWAGMGRELAGCCPVFAARLARCSRVLEPLTGWRVEDVLAGTGGAPGLDREEVLQPVLWAVSVALAAVWQAAGVVPDAVAGHSQGEVAAAVVAGVLSLEDAAAVIAGRSRVLMRLAGQGGMLSVAEPAAQVRERIAGFGGRLSVAVVNSPAATVVSGELSALEELAARCAAAGVRTHRVPIGYASHSAQAEQVREELLRVLDGIAPRAGVLPMVSAMTGELVRGPELGAGYWYASLRSPVDFERTVRVLAGGGHRVFVEVSAHPVLTTAITQTLEEAAAADADGPATVVTGTLRRGDGGPGRLLTSLAQAYVHGVTVDWAAVLGGGQTVDLPTYPFQRQRYWPRPGRAADVRSAGLGTVGHPLLGAVVELAGDKGLVLTGRLSVQAQPWLADQAIGGTALLPGTALVELAAAAGHRAGCGQVAELMLEAPLLLPGDGGVQVQVATGVPDDDGRRPVEVFTRPDDGSGQPWVRHAVGVLAPVGPADSGDFADFAADWPPEGAVPADAEGLTGVRGVWRRGGEVFAEAVLAGDAARDARHFGLHPGLLEAVLSAAGLAADEEPSSVLRPSAWGGVSLHAAGAAVLRARLTRTGDTVSVTAADDMGTPVITVRSLDLRPTAAGRLEAAGGVRDALFGVDWARVPVPARVGGREPGRWAVVGGDWFGLGAGLVAARTDAAGYSDVAELAAVVAAGEPAPDVVLVCAGSGNAGSGGGALGEAGLAVRAVGRVLGLVQQFLAADVLADARLVVMTQGTSAVRPGENVTDLAGAAVAGLVRSAQSENPGRLVLADLYADAAAAAGVTGDRADLAGLLVAALSSGEPEVALWDGAVFGRRLVRLPRAVSPGPAAPHPRIPGTVLVTGGTGTLGGLTARHLAATGRARHLLLASRSGPAAPGVAGLAAAGAAAGAGVRVAACDASDREALAGLLGWAAPDCALSGVIHTAGVLDDGVITSLTPARVEAVLRAKAVAAWHLHELTREADLDQFVLFSSVSSVFGAGGQGNYAAANAFLDALAACRRAAGLSAVSVAWGPWEQAGGMAGRLGAGDLQRMVRGGVAALAAGEGLALLDAAMAREEALLVAARMDVAGIRTRAVRGEDVPVIWQGLVGRGVRPLAAAAGTGEGLRRRLAGRPGAERDRMLLDLVRSHAAAVLGHACAEAVEPGQAFRDLGFDSLTAVELRNRLGAATGLKLPATLVFDHPTPLAAARFLRGELLGAAIAVPAVPAVPAVAAVEEPVAIVGMGCRFPGGVTGPESMWELLAAGTDAISGFPADRGWDVNGEDGGASYAARGGFVAGAADFDAEFFGISPREALAMDPQQRLLLEVCWEALERAGIDPGSLRGSPAGVFAGGYGSGYAESVARSGARELEGHLMTGNATSVISGRVAYVLGLEGPAVTVDTACSSALVALHLATQSLRAGECTLALAGGVTVMASPGIFTEFSAQAGLAPDGRCKAFGAGADGTGWSEGAGVVVLERLSDARRHGHRVLAVVAGSAVNQDGASNGLTAPNGPSQQRVIRAALASARLSPGEVDAVEAHGTGTVLGDPIEAQALLATFGVDRNPDHPLWLGSVKSNIGHTQAAAGIAGVIKMVLALQHGVLPATLHTAEPSPHVDWSAGAVKLLSAAVPWAAGERPRRAGVSSFGISGTNAHAIIAEAPAGDGVRADGAARPGPGGQAAPLVAGVRAWLVSGRTAQALAAQSGRLAQWATARPGFDPDAVGWSLATTRAVFEHRAVITGPGREELAAGLAAVAEGEPAAGVVTGSVPPGGAGRVVLVFPGQGSQWAGMGRELAGCCPVFAARLAQCSAALAPLTGWRVEDVLTGADGAPDLDLVDVLQPALWAVMVSLAAVWQAAGVAPDAVVGHSQGEVAAACVAGILSLPDAAAVIAGRSRVLAALAGRGGMLSVAEPAAAVRERIAPFGDRLSVAVVNGPAATVVSGAPGALEELAADCERSGVRARMVPVDYASHSPQVEELREEILGALDGITPRMGTVPMVSAMTGELVWGPELGPEYWYASLRSPVDFDRAVRVLADAGHRVFIEVSPRPVLAAAITATLDDQGTQRTVVSGTLRRGDGGPGRILSSLAKVHVHGVAVDWPAVLGGGQRAELPTYAFQRRRYWPGPGRAADVGSAGLRTVRHPLLGAAVELAGDEGLLLTGRLSVQAQPWLAGHVVDGAVLLPGTAFVELAAQAGEATGCGRIEELTLEAPLVLPARGGGVPVQVAVGGPDQAGQRPVRVFSRPDDGSEGPWVRHAAGLLAPAGPAEAGDFTDFAASWPPEGAMAADAGDLPGVRAVWRRGAELFVEAGLPQDTAGEAGRFWLHPVLLDAVLGAALPASDGADGADGKPAETLLPFAWSGVSLHAPGAATLRARLTRTGDTVSITAADATSSPVITVRSLVLRPVAAGQLAAMAAGGWRDALFGVEWVRIQAPAAAGEPVGTVHFHNPHSRRLPERGRWAVTGDDWFGLGAGLAAAGADAAGYADVARLAAAMAAGEPVPDVVLVCAGLGDEDEAGAAERAAGRVLAVIQAFLEVAALADARLVIVTRGAASVRPGEGVADLAGAAVAGLVRSAQSENPGRFLLADLPADDTAAVGEGLVKLLAVALGSSAPGSGEPEVALREGTVFGRRLTRLPAAVPAGPGAPRVPGTVLVTGGTGTLGGLTARHLAATGRARQVVLASRSGPAAPGAAGLAAAVAANGAGVKVTACDAVDSGALAALLAGIPAAVPLTGVVHTAGVLDDGVITSLTPARVEAVMRPKAAAAWHLHQLTQGADLDEFLLFSSVSDVFGAGGQGNYAAANAFLDALAARRRAAGLPATSIAWGTWVHRAGIGRNLSEGDLARISRGGMAEMGAAEGLALLDAAAARDEALVVAARMDVSAVRAQAARGEDVPAIWRGLAGGAVRPRAAGGAGTDAGLRRRLAGLGVEERERVLGELVRSHAAAVLGHASSEAVEPGRAFKDLGFDSLTAVELRNRLGAATGLRLPATLIFDQPTPLAVARFLRGELLGGPDGAVRVVPVAVTADEPVAIVGLGCRFPGGVTGPEGMWKLLAEGTDAIEGLPADRGWELDRLSQGDCAAGGFVHDAAEFDAGFFGISPREALAMDPQQRLLLEVCWEALERAGIDPASLRGSAAGVFAGGYTSGYAERVALEGTGELDGHVMTGNATSVISGRVSYVLGLEGPAVTVDTACSSSLVALHLACQAIRAGECTMALAGGVTVMANLGIFAEFSAQGGLAPDGRCKAFGAGADGTGLAEGAGVVVLERLSDARRNGHEVLAVVAGSAVNQDGASNGLTAPNGPSQQRVIRAALASAGLSAADVDAVEAHGTGTVLGDPIEAQALLATYGQGRPEDRPLWLGSVKSNIGHTQAAAGIAGVIKMVLALRHGLLPPTLHAGEPSPHVDWSAGAVRLLTEAAPWAAGGRLRRAGVSSFGISGTNAHAIIAQAPAPDGTRSSEDEPELAGAGGASGEVVPLAAGARAWLVSGRTAGALRAQAGRLAQWVTARRDLGPDDVGWSLATTRALFEHRAVITGTSPADLGAGLAAVAAGEPGAGVVTGTVWPGEAGRVVLVFPGQGSQWAGMGRDLVSASPVFAARLAQCSAALQPFTGWSVEDVLAGADGAPGLEQADVLQPVLWAVMVALAAVWQAAGVVPDAVAGHSQGEIAAATVAGILTLPDAAAVVAGRSRVLTRLAGRGGMLSLAEPAAGVRDRIARFGERLSVAVVNSPAATVVSGEPGALEELAADCERSGIRARMLPVDYASHSAQVGDLRDEILSVLDGITPRQGNVPMVSAMTGELVQGPELDAEYWFASLRSPVDFERAVRVLAAAGHRVFVEASPHPVLTAAITQTLEDIGDPDADEPRAVVTGTLRRDDGGPGRLLASLAEVHVRGVAVDWAAVLGGGRRVELPTYAFERRRYWPRPGQAADVRAAGLGTAGHPLLAAAVELAGDKGLVLTGRLSVQAQPWLADHVIDGMMLLPGTAFVELAAAAGHRTGCGQVEELTLQAPLPIPADAGVQVQVMTGTPRADGRRPVEVFSRPDDGTDGPWVRHAAGLLAGAGPAGAGEFADFAASWPPDGAVPADVTGLYAGLAADGYGYGPAFRGLRAVWRRGAQVFAEAVLPDAAARDAGGYGLHPALLDAVLHTAGLAGLGGRPGEIVLPLAWRGISVLAAGASGLRARLAPDGEGGLTFVATDGTGAPVVTGGSVTLAPVEPGQLGAVRDGVRDALFTIEWAAVPVCDDGREPCRWAVAGDDSFGLRAWLADAAGYADVAGLAAAVAAGEPAPDVVLVCAAAEGDAFGGAGSAGAGGEAGMAERAAGRVLGVVQEFLAADVLADARLVVVTRGAAAVLPGEGVADLAGAAVAGLVRSAQSENPGRLVLADLPADAAAGAGLAELLSGALSSGEPEVALRGEAIFGRRLMRLSAAVSPGPAVPRPRAPGTVLVTGGTGTLGGLVARHLAATSRGTLLLASRSGPAALGVANLAAAVAMAGAGVRVAACDAADRDALAGLLAAVPGDCPLTGVIHAAGVLDDAVITSLTPRRVDAVMRPKARAAWHLHELTRDRDLDHFVLFSSMSAGFGSAGQGNYAAANAFLDALAAGRRAAGLPGVALEWGLWADASGMTGHLGPSDRERMARGGVTALTAQDGLALLDRAFGRDEALLVAARIDVAGIRARAARGEDIPGIWRGLAGGGARPAVAGSADADGLRRRLAGLGVEERERVLGDLVRSHAAAVLGHGSAEAVEPGRAFKDLGFDSLTAVELRNRLSAATGLRLSATLVFDHPTPVAAARFLRGELFGALGSAVPAAPVAAAPVVAASGEPVAIVGIGCRFPGGVVGPEGMWELLAAGTDAVSGFPGDRGWDASAGDGGASYAARGGFVAGAAEFDAGFFGISPREALAMDPQQRLLLEVCWEALERAGIAPVSLRGTTAGVFAGGFTSGYVENSRELDSHVMTGNATSVISGRVSYVLGLEGPAVTVDTACSSSLVALHLACQAIRAGECTMALAGGVSVLVSPGIFAEFSGQGGLAADGRCKAFSAAADGMGWGEGAGVVVLERLADARRNGHEVLAVVAGSAVNQDGASNGLTAPNGPSQQRVIRAALASAGLTPDQVDAVEAHGTGTVLGDPIEAQALLATYGQGRAGGRPLWLGSVKSNIGHTQAAAGIAGVIKMVLALRHGLLPRTLHAEEASPHVDWSAGTVRLLTEPAPWTAGGRPRRAGVSSFGISGTNAHAIIAEAPAPDSTRPGGSGGEGPGTVVSGSRGAARQATPLAAGAGAWLVSGRTADGLRAQAGRLAEWVAARPGLDPGDVGWSLATTRSVFEHRAVITGTSAAELAAGLAAVAAGEPGAGVLAGSVPPGGAGRVVLVFAGHGAQWARMGRELAGCCPVFAARLAQCSAALEPLTGWRVEDVLGGVGGAPDLEREDVLQPVLWAVSVALAAVWQAAGVAPDAVAGHSQGEIAAATVAGILTLPDAAAVIAGRSRVLMRLAGRGAMLSLAEPVAAVQERIAPYGARLSVAVVNSPAATVVSGEPEAVAELTAQCAAAGVRTHRVPIDYASHSAQVEELRDEIVGALDGIAPRAGNVPMISAMTGEFVWGPELDAGYWYTSLRSVVDFERAVQVLAGTGHRVFIEVSPHPVLITAVTQTLEHAAAADAPAAVVTGTLRRGDGGPGRILASLAEVHVHGVAVDWPAVLGGGGRAELPTYAFQRQRYWPRPSRAADVRSAGLGTVGHPLLGAAVEVASGQGLILTGRLSVQAQPWLADHVIGGAVLLPGTAFVELAAVAGHRVGCGQIEELTLQAPLVIPGDGGVQVQVMVGAPGEDGRRPVEIFSRADDGADAPWNRHAAGLLVPAGPAPAAEKDLESWPPRAAVPVDVTGLYEGLQAGGYGYGPAFRGLRAAWRRGGEVFAEVALPDAAAADAAGYGLHPALLDAVLHAVGMAGDEELSAGPGRVLLPFAWGGISLWATGAAVLRARMTRTGTTVAVTAADGTGTPVITVKTLALRSAAAGQLEAAVAGVTEALFGVQWAPAPVHGEPRLAGRWSVAGYDRFGLRAALALEGTDTAGFADVAELAAAVTAGEPAPDAVLICAGVQDADVAEAAEQAAGQVLGAIQPFLAADVLARTRLVVVTRGAAAALAGEGAADLASAAVTGLVRSAQSENPGRLVLADLPADDGTADGAGLAKLLAAALGSDEPEVALRDGVVLGRRLVRPDAGLARPDGDVPWRLESSGSGSLKDLVLAPCPEAAKPLTAGQVRIAIRAAGLNFRDVLMCLGMYPGTGLLGGEVAGVVMETGPGVTRLAAGDRVLGIAVGGFGPVAVTDARVLVPVPGGWGFAQAAAVPVAFGTAWYALADLAGAKAGQRLLVHAATGGVGMAAVGVARRLGLEVFATASPGKHRLLRAMGFDEDHIASSRDDRFEDAFLAATGGAGMDIVLNALAGELTDASLRLLRHGGVFLEMGKTDLRDLAQVARDHPRVAYRPFDLGEVGPDRLGEILTEVTRLLGAGQLASPPVRAWDVRRAPEAFRFMSQARHVGKIVLTVPPDPAAPRVPGTVLVTGGTGALGGLVGRHLAATGRARQVLLASRSGPAAPDAARLAAEMAARGAAARVTACDAADRDALAGLLAAIPRHCPLTGVIHAAGVLDDGVVTSLTPARIGTVMRAKAGAAWHLHELTRDHDLDHFVLFSSVSAVFGAGGQGNYAAANTFLDALAACRRAAGLLATSIAWGTWVHRAGIGRNLSKGDLARISRSGLVELGAEEGLALLDRILGRDEALLVAARMDVAGVRAQAAKGEHVPVIWRGLAGGTPRPAAVAGVGGDRLRRRLSELTAEERDRTLLDLVRSHAAAVLGHAAAEAIEAGRAFKDLGFDSLTAIELRNRLSAATGLKLPATLIFDHPTSSGLAAHLRAEISPAGPAPAEPVFAELDQLDSALSEIPADSDIRASITARLQAVLSKWMNAQGPQKDADVAEKLQSATADEVLDFINKEFGGA